MSTFNGSSNRKLEVDLSGKRLKSLSSDLLQKSQDVDKLDLQKNRLKEVTGISYLSNLTQLNLCRNELTEFPKEISKLVQLLTLYVSQNNIKSISENIFPSLKKLQFLKMNTNRLSQLPSDMNKCENLIYLNLSNNCLDNVQPLVGLGQLKELYLENNRLRELPHELFLNSKNLKKFKVNNNPLRTPPEAICINGLKDILTYFEMIKERPITECTIKTMFLGSSGAGKSTVCRSLKHGHPVEVDKDDRTVGIEIQEVSNERGIRFLFWDFAGQEEYYYTHHAFITSEAFVILVVDLYTYTRSDQSFKENVGFWISNIQLKVPNAVVLLLGTHVDCCSGEEEVSNKKKDIEQRVHDMLLKRKESLQQQKGNLKELEDTSLFLEQITAIEKLEEYKLEVLDFKTINCKNREDISEIEHYISKVVLDPDKFPFLQQTLSESFKDVENSIQKNLDSNDIPQHGIVNFTDLLTHLNTSEKELDLDSLRMILKYLHRIGVIMWYTEIAELKDKVFVKPSVLISLFKAIVRQDLDSMLRNISKNDLMKANSLQKHRDKWISEFTNKGILSNVAIRILVHAELQRSGVDDEEMIEEIVGNKKKAGSLLRLLQHFDICLPIKECAKLNPAAPEFCPNKKWEPTNHDIYEPNGAHLFPYILQKNNQDVMKMWGEDNLEDITVWVYFLPEIPHGFFHRLVVRTCSIFSTHWIDKDRILFTAANKRLLVVEHAGTEKDQFIEFRGKHSDVSKPADIHKIWDMIKVVMMWLTKLTKQWRGLCQYVHSPCKEKGCNAFFEWRDWQDWLEPNACKKFNMKPEERLTCSEGHTHKTELLFPVQ